MAGVIGGSAGYATVNPTQGNPIGDALANVENSAFRYRAEKTEQDQIKAQAARQLQEDRRRDMEDAYKFSKDNPFIATGTGLDAVNRQSYINAKDTAAKAYAEYLKTGDRKQQAIYENAVASVNNISEFPKQINALKEDWVKNAGNYNAESLKRKAALLDQIASGQIVQTNDANGNPKYTVFDRDENGNINKLAHKDLNSDQLLKLLTPEKGFNIDGKDGFIDLFNKNIGKERKVIEGTGLNAVEKTYNPGAEDLAKIMANDAVNDRSKMYETLQRMGMDPEDNKNYTDDTVKKAAATYLEKMLMVTAPTTVSKKPDTSIEQLNLAYRKEANDERQRTLENNRNAAKDAKEAEETQDKTTFSKHILKEAASLPGTKYVVPAGTGKITVNSKGYKDVSGATRILQQVLVTPKGEVFYGVNQSKVNKAQLTPDAQKRKNEPDFDYNDENNYVHTEKVVWSSSKNHGDRVALAVLNTKNPETGKKFKSVQEADRWAKSISSADNSAPKPAVPKKETAKKYSSIEEKAIATAMKNNPGYSREEIISALKLK